MKRFLGLFRGHDGRNHALAFALVSSLFLLWGFCNGLLDILNKHFQDTLHVSKTESALIQFSHYLGYFCMAIPSGLVARKFGYKGGILVGLAFIGVGAFGFIPATHVGTFGAFLASLFVVAIGLTFLETVANPYATVLGPADSGATRINLAQTCNAVGWILGPYVGGLFIFSGGGEGGNGSLYVPYLFIGCVVVVLFVLFSFVRLPVIREGVEEGLSEADEAVPLGRRPHFLCAIAAQFAYVAAQTGIFSYFINYITSPDMPSFGNGLAGHLPSAWKVDDGDLHRFSNQGASGLLAFGGFVLFLLGRLSGSFLLRVFRAHALLAAFALANVILMALILLHLGWISAAALFLSFFFMSIMYPTIFALGIHGLGGR
ncbi:MAG TPA: MFS transporter, partial [Candidatus Methylacidiphilales bacterium]